MRKIVFASAMVALVSGCASQKPSFQRKEKSQELGPLSSRTMAENPEQVLRAAKAVLEELVRDSNPPTTESVKGDENALYTGWVYSLPKQTKPSKSGSPQPQEPGVRRIYGYTVTPVNSGSQVALTVEEEVQLIDPKGGKPQGWKRLEPSRAVFEMLLQKLREKLRYN